MFAMLTMTEPVFVDCEHCGGTGECNATCCYDAGFRDCMKCEAMGDVALDIDWLVTLAHNLAIAGGLARTNSEGYWFARMGLRQ